MGNNVLLCQVFPFIALYVTDKGTAVIKIHQKQIIIFKNNTINK